MEPEAKRKVFVVKDVAAQKPVSSGLDTQFYLVTDKGIKGPYQTFTESRGEVNGFRKLESFALYTPLPDMAKTLGYDDFESLPDYLKGVVSYVSGQAVYGEFYLKKARVTEEERKIVDLLIRHLRSKMDPSYY